MWVAFSRTRLSHPRQDSNLYSQSQNLLSCQLDDGDKLRTQALPHRQRGGGESLLRRRRWSDSNRRTQSCSLLPKPLRHSANERNNVTHTRERVYFSARPPGIEPGPAESESAILPIRRQAKNSTLHESAKSPHHVDNANNSIPTRHASTRKAGHRR